MEVTTLSSGTSVSGFASKGLGELIEEAVDKEVVDYCYFSREAVVVSVGGRQFTYGRAEAAEFLNNLLLGWSRSQSRMQHTTVAADLRRRSGSTAAYAREHQAARGALDQLQAVLTRGRNQVPGGADPDYLDTVLALAREMGLIESYRKDEAAQRVTLHTKATTADLSYYETLEYLTGSILDELRPERQD